jgi:hypothetical protein
MGTSLLEDSVTGVVQVIEGIYNNILFFIF